MSFSIQLFPVESPQAGSPNHQKEDFLCFYRTSTTSLYTGLRLPIPCTCSSLSPQINSTSSGIQIWNLIEIWNLIGGMWWSFSAAPFFREQSTCSVDCFRRGASLLIFDRILNMILLEDLFTTWVTQGNLELLLPPNSLDSHKNTKTIR